MSCHQAISTSKAPAALGPYSQAVKAGGMIFVSGQLGLDPGSGAFVGATATEQARRALENVRTILQAAGSDMGEVVKVTVYLADLEAFAEVNKVYGEFFRDPFPARACIQAARLPKNALVEVDAVAVAH